MTLIIIMGPDPSNPRNWVRPQGSHIHIYMYTLRHSSSDDGVFSSMPNYLGRDLLLFFAEIIASYT